ncbi:BAP_1a_G0043510.mRNA.1.CDS.1 [Saccharomyces cerevisiae]|nr:BAP_1a_G0043510.mRNA.1.CDS.1 [Saccharomyces cerevisiae]CAI7290056.1 BAP_1a_G0043510.mRNA.1.CDS.1 [Saccharomyces cerevisiae]
MRYICLTNQVLVRSISSNVTPQVSPKNSLGFLVTERKLLQLPRRPFISLSLFTALSACPLRPKSLIA